MRSTRGARPLARPQCSRARRTSSSARGERPDVSSASASASSASTVKPASSVLEARRRSACACSSALSPSPRAAASLVRASRSHRSQTQCQRVVRSVRSSGRPCKVVKASTFDVGEDRHARDEGRGTGEPSAQASGLPAVIPRRQRAAPAMSPDSSRIPASSTAWKTSRASCPLSHYGSCAPRSPWPSRGAAEQIGIGVSLGFGSGVRNARCAEQPRVAPRESAQRPRHRSGTGLSPDPKGIAPSEPSL